jgi:hypothetical protein
MSMEERINPVGMIMTFPGVTQEQYEAVLQQLNLGGRMPPGGIFHAAGPIEGGWRVVDVWETQEAFDIFLREKLEQAMQNAGMAPPEVEVWPVYSTLEAAVP